MEPLLVTLRSVGLNRLEFGLASLEILLFAFFYWYLLLGGGRTSVMDGSGILIFSVYQVLFVLTLTSTPSRKMFVSPNGHQPYFYTKWLSFFLYEKVYL